MNAELTAYGAECCSGVHGRHLLYGGLYELCSWWRGSMRENKHHLPMVLHPFLFDLRTTEAVPTQAEVCSETHQNEQPYVKRVCDDNEEPMVQHPAHVTLLTKLYNTKRLHHLAVMFQW